MIRLKVRGGAAAHALQSRRHRPLARGENGAGEADLHVVPNRSRKDGAKIPMTLVQAIGKERRALLAVEENTGFHCRSMVTQIVING